LIICKKKKKLENQGLKWESAYVTSLWPLIQTPVHCPQKVRQTKRKKKIGESCDPPRRVHFPWGFISCLEFHVYKYPLVV
jgi:hypothetical protein